MRTARFVLAIAAIALPVLAGLAWLSQGSPDGRSAPDPEHASIVFVCQNGVAMSVWSALTFDRLAAEHGLPVRAISRASMSTYTQIPLRMRLALALDGLRAGGYRPQVISAADVRGARRVILIDTALPPSASAPGASIERWDGFPPMREEYFASRAALRSRIEELVARLAASPERAAAVGGR
jgi:hypothetical protein